MSELGAYSGLAAQTLAEIAEIDRRIASLIELRDHGISADYVAALSQTGLKALPLEQLVALRDHGVSASYVEDLRTAGFPVEVPPTELKFGKALGQADKVGAQFALILGEDEVAEGMWTLKNLADGNQVKLPEPELIDHLRNLGSAQQL